MLMVMGMGGNGGNGAAPTKAGLEALVKHSAWKSDDPPAAFLSASDAAVGGHGRDWVPSPMEQVTRAWLPEVFSMWPLAISRTPSMGKVSGRSTVTAPDRAVAPVNGASAFPSTDTERRSGQNFMLRPSPSTSEPMFGPCPAGS